MCQRSAERFFSVGTVYVFGTYTLRGLGCDRKDFSVNVGTWQEGGAGAETLTGGGW